MNSAGYNKITNEEYFNHTSELLESLITRKGLGRHLKFYNLKIIFKNFLKPCTNFFTSY